MEFKKGDRVIVIWRVWDDTTNTAIPTIYCEGTVNGLSDYGNGKDYYLVEYELTKGNLSEELHHYNDLEYDIQYYREEKLKNLLD